MASYKVVFAFLSLFVTLSRADCPQHGCTPYCSYVSDAYFLTASTPKLQWSWQSVPGGARLSGAGCVTNDARIVCTLSGDDRSYLISWGTADNGKTPWNISFSGNVVLPIMDIHGALITSDGYVLVGYNSDGTPFGQAVPLFPVNGQLFDLTLVNSEVALLYKCGFLVTYFTNGVPHASIWLNDTIDSEYGTFIPLAGPASKGQRLYILGAFRPHSPSAQNGLGLRLYAIDLSSSTVYRIIIAWHYDFTIPNVSLSYLNSSETVCTLKYPKIDKESTQPLAHITVNYDQDYITVLLNYREPNAGHEMNNSRMMIFKDMGKEGTLVFTEDSTYIAQALAYSESSSYWTALFDTQRKQSFLERHNFATGTKIMTVDIASLIGVGDKSVSITSEMVYLETHSNSVLVFCVMVDSTQSMLVALFETTIVYWTVSLGSEQCVGQITSVDGGGNSFLIVTTPSQMYVYGL